MERPLGVHNSRHSPRGDGAQTGLPGRVRLETKVSIETVESETTYATEKGTGLHPPRLRPPTTGHHTRGPAQLVLAEEHSQEEVQATWHTMLMVVTAIHAMMALVTHFLTLINHTIYNLTCVPAPSLYNTLKPFPFKPIHRLPHPL